MLGKKKKKVGKKLLDIGPGNDFFNMSPKAQAIETKINKWDCICFKSSTQQRKLSIEQKDNLQNGRK